ncbi:hypothetical protein EW145_g60 [Phellinidium pouzarii]|uniref:CCHC-type domain-containing protein n=1 Tax=Phellinidium pouzarii TaxID=167371 RepID=A0A4S4LLS2_9AGAM|nr:hypothetical protein EW145_g60 [Phellinidium pouzarii]
MSSRAVEVIDLTESAPQSPLHIKTVASPALCDSSLVKSRRVVRRRKRSRTEPTSSEVTPILVSDGEEPTSPSFGITSVRKLRLRSKRKLKLLEDGEVTNDGEGGHNSLATGQMNSVPTNGSVDSLGHKSPQRNDRISHEDSRRPLTPSSASLFYLDDQPDPFPALPVEEPANAETAELSNSDVLLLPDHVKVNTPGWRVPVVAEASTLIESDEEEFIHYADGYETQNNGARYYDEPEDVGERRAHYVCCQCGVEGDHKSADCPVVICLTCGAHDEHSTRGCPIVKTCFNCGLKGHINKDCPNRFTARRLMNREFYDDCGRCGSDLHSIKECPTLWRIYEYVDDAEREATLRMRKEKENLRIGQGGEGYIGDDLWCYNCGEDDHLGDDCDEALRPPDFPKEPSAFGSHNIMSGPFADLLSNVSRRHNHEREWEVTGKFDDGHGFAGPSDVGKRGRDKERERMRRREEEVQQVHDDDDDWFGSRLQSAARTHPRPLAQDKKKAIQRMVFEFRDASEKQRPADNLLARISSHSIDKDKDRGNRNRDHDRRSGKSSRSHHSRDYKSDGKPKRDREHERERNRTRDRDYDRDHYRARDPGRLNRDVNRLDEGRSGQRYHGGYSR